MRDHTKLKAFQLADAFVPVIYHETRLFPKDEQFGLTSQIRRAAVSVPSNIVEGCARKTEADYLRFLDIAFGSSRELEYHISLAFRLGYVDQNILGELFSHCQKISKVLGGLIRSYRK